jgi:hypothetical protein
VSIGLEPAAAVDADRRASLLSSFRDLQGRMDLDADFDTIATFTKLRTQRAGRA